MRKIIIISMLCNFLMCFSGDLPAGEQDTAEQTTVFTFNVYDINAGPAMLDNPHRDENGEIIEELRNLGPYERFFWNQDETESQCTDSPLFSPAEKIRLYLDDFRFELSRVLNDVNPDADWRLSGQAVFQNHYADGMFVISMNDQPKIYLNNCSFSMIVPLPPPHGFEAPIKGQGTAFIDYEKSDPEWISKIDNETGKLQFNFTSASPPVQGLYGKYDITVNFSKPNI